MLYIFYACLMPRPRARRMARCAARCALLYTRADYCAMMTRATPERRYYADDLSCRSAPAAYAALRQCLPALELRAMFCARCGADHVYFPLLMLFYLSSARVIYAYAIAILAAAAAFFD